ncbi:MAG: hypothetical protein NDP19_05505 [Crenarchaeota archaeon]|nr:hypothetical protein [Thermoproteota archaeon]
MRLLYIAPRYHPHVGGVEYVVKSVAERLAERGHEAIEPRGEPGVDNPKEEWINNVRVVRWPIWVPGHAYLFPRLEGPLVLASGNDCLRDFLSQWKFGEPKSD